MSSVKRQINYIIKKVSCNPSIKAVKEKSKIKSKFWFNLVSTETIKGIIKDLDIKKTSLGEIPTWLFKKLDFALDIVTLCVNEELKMGSFPDRLK